MTSVIKTDKVLRLDYDHCGTGVRNDAVVRDLDKIGQQCQTISTLFFSAGFLYPFTYKLVRRIHREC